MKEKNIVNVIGRRIALTKKGTSYWGLCPFHKLTDDSLPQSMIVDEESNTFRCLYCKAEGSAEDFVRRFDAIEEDLNEV